MPVREDMLSALCGGEIAHIVMLHPEQSDVPQDVESALHPFRHSCQRFSQPLSAFAELALYDRLDSTRSAWGLAAPGIRCLVIVEGPRCADTEELASAVAKYFPQIAVIEFDETLRNPWRVRHGPAAGSGVESNHPLRRAHAPPVEPAERTQRDASASSPPSLRLVDHGAGGDDSEFPRRARAAAEASPHDPGNDVFDDDAAPSVTRDEIAMLLRGETGDDDDAPEVRRGAAP